MEQRLKSFDFNWNVSGRSSSSTTSWHIAARKYDGWSRILPPSCTANLGSKAFWTLVENTNYFVWYMDVQTYGKRGQESKTETSMLIWLTWTFLLKSVQNLISVYACVFDFGVTDVCFRVSVRDEIWLVVGKV